jgi:RNA polymerase sigma factor (sigma-70 family)
MERRLSAEAEVALGRAARDGAAAAREALIQENRGLVGMVARQFLGRGLELEDLMQEGVIGLAAAVDRWDPERGVRFATYAVPWIRQRVSRAVQNGGELVRRPPHVHERWGQVERRRLQLAGEWGREPSVAELAAAVGLAVEQLEALRPVAVVSLDGVETAGGDPAAGRGRAREVAAMERVEEVVVERCARSARAAVLRRLLAHLAARDRQVLLRRLEGETLRAIGTDLGLSREGVRQIGERALGRLRAAAAALTPAERETLEG